MNYTKEQIAAALDLAVLKPTATRAEIIAAARLVQKHDIASICVAPCAVQLAKQHTDRVCAVIGFPHGNTSFTIKHSEALLAISEGASELDVVVNYGAFLDGNSAELAAELMLTAAVAHSVGGKVKAILETCYYSPDQITRACELCVEAGVDFVKTSTGFGPQGATPGVVRLILAAVRGRCGVKASGGIHSYEDARTYLDLGVTRIGSSRFSELLP